MHRDVVFDGHKVRVGFDDDPVDEVMDFMFQDLRDQSDRDPEVELKVRKDPENGNWSLELDAPLAEGQGLRTISTIRNYGVIEYFEAGSSSKLSRLFVGGFEVYLPMVLSGN